MPDAVVRPRDRERPYEQKVIDCPCNISFGQPLFSAMLKFIQTWIHQGEFIALKLTAISMLGRRSPRMSDVAF